MKDTAQTTRPRLGFLGLGWIGRHRMEAIAAAGGAEIVALADVDAGAREAASTFAPAAAHGETLEDVLAAAPDGVVIATPSALHAAQSIAALEAGAAVFCQKPLGRDAAETATAVEAARSADRLLATDLSYRQTAAVLAAREEIASLGEIQAVDLTFHNAYGPDKPWFRDRRLAGGGCVIDLGVHLVDLAMWLMDWPELTCRSAHLRAGGAPLRPGAAEVEDLALATLETAQGTPVRLACSWNLPAGCDAVIRAEIYGAHGAVAVSNVGGSFFDLEARRMDGCTSTVLASPPDDWGGRAAVAWMERLRSGTGFDPECARLIDVARVLDDIYAVGGAAPPAG
ncbi:Gfo/Idh/MocA family protein [Pseudoroseicyclus tamaricis]|uniref:Gfo/Idh/MocA family oxidoreductase n=1 Tax=Pseudoroseicyclus tamaricis TaxID=2705421 RepID=A0A6B2K0F8_9RHOB|nr:Gfo/Idh/MocA family oxidoreductase [Pseudoroseicyclus tamaricis]NDU99795.1 Gfo/Idh/MocA family oxidoreductase [Pseudoroseicyclus tamaricis]